MKKILNFVMYNRFFQIVFIGIFIYILIIFFFASLYNLSGCINYNSSKFQTASYFDCIYFSFISFATIGYGDIIPTCNLGKNILFLETTIAFFYTPIFGGIILREFLRRDQNIIFPRKLKSFCIQPNKISSISFNLNNKGSALIDCKLSINIYDNNSSKILHTFKIENDFFKNGWFIEIREKENYTLLKSISDLRFISSMSFKFRLSFSGVDSFSNESILMVKEYDKYDLIF